MYFPALNFMLQNCTEKLAILFNSIDWLWCLENSKSMRYIFVEIFHVVKISDIVILQTNNSIEKVVTVILHIANEDSLLKLIFE